MKRIRSAVLLLSVLVPASIAVAAPPAPVSSPKGLYDAAMVAAKAGNYSRAIDLCRETLKLSPDVGPVWATLARLLSEQKRHTEAIVASQKAVVLSPKNAPFRADLANFYLRAGKRAEAEANARKALALDSKNDVALTTLATCLLAERRDKEAIPFLERLLTVRGGNDLAVSQTVIATYRRSGNNVGAMNSAKAFAKKNPKDPERVLTIIYLALANNDRPSTQTYIAVLEKLAPKSPLPDYFRGRLALADTTKSDMDRLRIGEQFFEKAVKRSPNEPILRAQLGYSQLGQNTPEKFDAARTNLTAALLYGNHDPNARRGLALVAEKQNFWDDAAAQYEALLKITPEDNDSRRRYAGVLLSGDRKEEAFRQFYELASRLPNDTRYLKELASFFMVDKQYAKARGAYAQALERNPDDTDSMLGIAQCFVNENKKPEARDAFERTIKENPKLETAYLLLAQLYLDDGADKESLQTLERLMAAVPDSNAGRWLLIERYIGQKKDADALREIGKLTLKSNDPNRTRYRLATGNLYLARERWADAISEFERLLSEEPENPEIAVTLADAYTKAGRKAEADDLYGKSAKLAESILFRSPGDQGARIVLRRARKALNTPDAAESFLKKLDESGIRNGR